MSVKRTAREASIAAVTRTHAARGGRKLLRRQRGDQRVGVAMHEQPIRTVTAEAVRDMEGHVLVGQPADLLLLPLDLHKNQRVIRA